MMSKPFYFSDMSLRRFSFVLWKSSDDINWIGAKKILIGLKDSAVLCWLPFSTLHAIAIVKEIAFLQISFEYKIRFH